MVTTRSAARAKRPVDELEPTTQKKPAIASGNPSPKQRRMRGTSGKTASSNKRDTADKPSDLVDRAKDPKPAPQKDDEPTVKSNGLRIVELQGDLFDAPENALIIHACNTQGSWGGGIARAFAELYPNAYKAHRQHCASSTTSELVGTAQLIQPCDSETDKKVDEERGTDEDGKGVRPRHWIGCLFTSSGYGNKKDTPTNIARATGPAMIDLLTQRRNWNAACRSEAEGDEAKRGEIGEVWMCRINSGLFATPWAKTKAELLKLDVSDLDVSQITVMYP